MRFVNSALTLIFLVAVPVAAQPPEPGVWFGSSSLGNARLTDHRFQIDTTATGIVILSAPFGTTPVSWGPIALGQEGVIEFHWTGDPSVLCVLRRSDDRNYGGTCRGSGGRGRTLTLTRNRPPGGLELPLTKTDFQILAKAQQILSGPSVWNRRDDRYCEDDAKQHSWSLFCALYQASVEVTGNYLPLRPVAMEIRAAAGEVANGKSFDRIILEYNNLESTTYANIAAVFDRAKLRLETRKSCAEQPDSKWSPIRRYTLPLANGAVVPQGREAFYWGEGVSYTTQKKTYSLVGSVGPLTTSGKVPDDWLAASSAISVQTWKRGDLGGVDVKGDLPNGNHWRYFCQCGQSLRYYDVPAEAVVFFDRVIDGAYPHRRR